MITTNDEATYRKLIRLRSHGINKLDDPLQLPEQGQTNGVRAPWYYEMQDLGYHYRITDMQCGLALSQLSKLEKFLARRLNLVNRYDQAFVGLPNCRPAQSVGRNSSGHHLYVLRFDFDAMGLDRSQVMQGLKSRGIGTQVHYIPVPAHPYYRKLGHRLESYPHAQKYYQEALSIPLYYDLTEMQQDSVISAIKELVA